MLKFVTLGLLVVGAIAVAESQSNAVELANHRTKVQRFFGYGFGEGYHAYSCCYPCPDYYQRQMPLAAPVYQSSIYQSTRGTYPYYHWQQRGHVGYPSAYNTTAVAEPTPVEAIPSGSVYSESEYGDGVYDDSAYGE